MKKKGGGDNGEHMIGLNLWDLACDLHTATSILDNSSAFFFSSPSVCASSIMFLIRFVVLNTTVGL